MLAKHLRIILYFRKNFTTEDLCAPDGSTNSPFNKHMRSIAEKALQMKRDIDGDGESGDESGDE